MCAGRLGPRRYQIAQRFDPEPLCIRTPKGYLLDSLCTSDSNAVPTIHHHDMVKRLFMRALASGGRSTRSGVAEWDVSGNCQSPIYRLISARPPKRGRDGFIVVGPGRPKPVSVELTVRCRKCDKCRMMRKLNWAGRARVEWQTAARTWLGTLTLRPDAAALMLSRARRLATAKGLDYDALSFGEQFVRLHNECGKELTLAIKRMRERYPSSPFRYMAVAEQHKSGMPHYHMLIHESDPDGPLKYVHLAGDTARQIAPLWTWGFTKWNLVHDERGATYSAKYLSKTTAARVRASVDYGVPPMPASPHRGGAGVENPEPAQRPGATPRVD